MFGLPENLQGVVIGGLFGFGGALLGTLINIWATNQKMRRDNIQATRLRIVGDHVQTSEVMDFIASQRKRLWPRFWIQTSADLSRAQLEHVDFRHQRLPNLIFTKANLHGANFARANLSGSDFAEADLSEASFYYATFRKTSFFKANLSDIQAVGADFSQAGMIGCNFENAHLHRAILREIDMRSSSFHGTILTKADLRGSNVANSNFQYAILTGVRLEQTIYNRETIWPDGFDPKAAGAELVELSGSAHDMAANGRKITNAVITKGKD